MNEHCNKLQRNRHSPKKLLVSRFLCIFFGFYALGCAKVDLTLPSDREVADIFASSPSVSASMNGNVVEVIVEQPLYQIRRGGHLWAKVGPYIYLFTAETESIFQQFPVIYGPPKFPLFCVFSAFNPGGLRHPPPSLQGTVT